MGISFSQSLDVYSWWRQRCVVLIAANSVFASNWHKRGWMEAIFYLKMLKTKNDFLFHALCWSITQLPVKQSEVVIWQILKKHSRCLNIYFSLCLSLWKQLCVCVHVIVFLHVFVCPVITGFEKKSASEKTVWTPDRSSLQNQSFS